MPQARSATPMRPARLHLPHWAAALCLSALLTGCATPNPASQHADAATPDTYWSGRLSLTIGQEPPKAFFTSFHLAGSAQQGTLDLFNPLGSTVAQIRWTPTLATVQQGQYAREYPDLDNLLADVAGAPIPVSALFGWLAGRPMQVPGWQADLSRQPEGRISARRLQPLPQARLQVILSPSAAAQ